MRLCALPIQIVVPLVPQAFAQALALGLVLLVLMFQMTWLTPELIVRPCYPSTYVDRHADEHVGWLGYA